MLYMEVLEQEYLLSCARQPNHKLPSINTEFRISSCHMHCLPLFMQMKDKSSYPILLHEQSTNHSMYTVCTLVTLYSVQLACLCSQCLHSCRQPGCVLVFMQIVAYYSLHALS